MRRIAQAAAGMALGLGELIAEFWMPAAIVAVCLVLGYGLCQLEAAEQRDCLSHHGSWQITGWDVITTGKTTTIAPNYGCVGGTQ